MKYQSTSFGFIIRIERGEELPAALLSFSREQSLAGGFLFGLGAVREARLGMYHLERREYDFRSVGPSEIASLTGNLAERDGELMLHLHAVLAGENQEALGGHLDSAIIEPTCEIAFYTAPAISRQYDETTGLSMLDLADEYQAD